MERNGAGLSTSNVQTYLKYLYKTTVNVTQCNGMTLTQRFNQVLASADHSIRLRYNEMSYTHKLIVLKAFKRHDDANRALGITHVEAAWLNEFIKDFGVNHEQDVR